MKVLRLAGVIALFLTLALLVIHVWNNHIVRTAGAHEHPINGKRNASGEWCCGEGDCFVIDPRRVSINKTDYVIWPEEANADRYFSKVEIIPERDAMPSPDGQYWRCKRPDGSRRCFFAPQPSM